MDQLSSLTEEQLQLLRRFQEIANVEDVQVAIATLASVNWDVQMAVEAQLTHDPEPPELGMPGDNDDDDNDDPGSQGIDFSFLSPLDLTRRLAAGGSSRRNGERSSPRVSNGSLGRTDRGSTREALPPQRRTRRIPIQQSESSSQVTATSSYDRRTITLSDSETDNDNNGNDNDNNDNDGDEYDFRDAFGRVDDEIDSRPTTNDDRVPLVPSDFSSLDEAQHNFLAVYEARYGTGHPPFYSGTLQDAVREAFEAPGRSIAERRPLAIYLHNDNSVASNVFAKNVVCADVVAQLLKGQFVTWSWDVTQAENKQKFFEWIDALNFHELRVTLQRLSDDRYPIILILVKDKGVVQPVEYASGTDDAQQVVFKLMEGLDQYQHIKSAEAAEERQRLEREEIRQEQAREYEEALQRDRARQEQLERERNEQIAEEARRLKAEEEKAKYLRQLAESLPAEPALSEKGVATVRVRFPDGSTETRRFRMTEPLRNVTTFVESKGYSLENHRIWTSDVPKKNVIESFDLNRFLVDLKWPVREQITVDEK